jgi:hypothetical protein
MKTEIIGYIVAGVLLFPCTGGSQEPDVKVPPRATVNGNYSKLLRIIKVPVDQKLVGDFCDLGYYPETEYAEYKDLEHGYWVYVAPNWYIWRNSKKPREPEPTIDGPEAQDILGRITGYVVIARGTSEIVALSLPTMRETVVRPEPKETPISTRPSTRSVDLTARGASRTSKTTSSLKTRRIGSTR